MNAGSSSPPDRRHKEASRAFASSIGFFFFSTSWSAKTFPHVPVVPMPTL
jgi:hypothetical protein